MHRKIIQVCFFVMLCVHAQGNNASAHLQLTEVDLQEILFKRYNRNVMPKLDISVPIAIGIEMHMMSIDDIDEKKQTITIRAFLEFTWNDELLKWNPGDYSNVSRINVKVEDIWTPDIALENTFDKPTELGQEGGNANVHSDGTVIMWPYNTYTVACKIYIANFPFDRQTCTFQFLSWTNPQSVLMLNNSSGKIHMNQYSESGEWNLLENRVYNRRKPYGDDFWDLMIFELQLERKSLYHIMNVMIPVLCISLLNVFCFLLPSEGGERVTLSISIFLTLAVFLTIVNSSMPESSDEVAKFGVFVGLQLLGSALTIIVTTMSLYIFYRGEDRKISKVFKLLVRLSCVAEPKQATIYINGLRNCNGDQHQPIGGDTNSNFVEVDSSKNRHFDDSYITWKLVSRAVDRLCFVSAFVWHIVLIVVLIGTIMN